MTNEELNNALQDTDHAKYMVILATNNIDYFSNLRTYYQQVLKDQGEPDPLKPLDSKPPKDKVTNDGRTKSKKSTISPPSSGDDQIPLHRDDLKTIA